MPVATVTGRLLGRATQRRGWLQVYKQAPWNCKVKHTRMAISEWGCRCRPHRDLLAEELGVCMLLVLDHEESLM